MHGDENGAVLGTKSLIQRLILLLAISIGIGVAGSLYGGLNMNQAVATSVFLAIIMGTLFFWTFRLAIAFLGLGVLIFTKSLNIPHFVEAAALPVILFLVGMMIVVPEDAVQQTIDLADGSGVPASKIGTITEGTGIVKINGID